MAIQSGNDEAVVGKDRSYSPASETEQEQAQATPNESIALEDPEIDSDSVKSLPGAGGPDDVGEVDVDSEAIREGIAKHNRERSA